ncbi:hypothetical protein E2C01_069393 [Portunus trituberculatus]|uniref:Uncharacterized protein n=1 Tax=Portunus trituberculatus TaxID=210409 RepID=A0A5B7HRG3_PORTR|nr:hypothetical protein [Portunus trituberculatus]
MLGVSLRRSGIRDSKVEGQFTRMVSEGKGKLKLVVNIEISKGWRSP